MNSHDANSVTRREATPQLRLVGDGDLALASTSPRVSRPSGHPPRFAVLIRRFPVAAFMVWFFTVGQAIAFIPLLARSLYGLDLATAPFLITAAFVGLLLPAVVITWITDGAGGCGRCGNDRWPSTSGRAGTP